MRKAVLFILMLLLAAVSLSAQVKELDDVNMAEKPTYVLILKDGEQVVIRGDYDVRGELTYFYLDRGGYPVYSSMFTEKIDLEATVSANEQLVEERRRRENYYRLIEERRRRLLEQSRESDVQVITDTSGGMRVEETGEGDDSIVPRTVAEMFPPYEELDVVNQPENWWREESGKLFDALSGSNARLRTLAAENDRLTFAYNRARTADEAGKLQEQINAVRADIVVERERARLIGDRLVELSEHAETQGVPIDWILPTEGVVLDENSQVVPTGSALSQDRSERTDAYTAQELRNVADEWWAREMAYLQREISAAESKLNGLRTEYNALVTQRNESESETEKTELSVKIDNMSREIENQIAATDRVRGLVDSLITAARALGKEEALGVMRDRSNNP